MIHLLFEIWTTFLLFSNNKNVSILTWQGNNIHYLQCFHGYRRISLCRIIQSFLIIFILLFVFQCMWSISRINIEKENEHQHWPNVDFAFMPLQNLVFPRDSELCFSWSWSSKFSHAPGLLLFFIILLNLFLKIS